MVYNAEFLEEEEVIRITNDEYVPIRRDDLSGRIDVDITVSTAEDNAAKVQELSFLLQTLGPSEDPTIRRNIMADIYELSRMPEEAKRLREYQPEPDPVQEQMKQLELERMALENEKIKAEVTWKQSLAQMDPVDAELKMRKAEVEAAKARKLEAEADLKDLEFVAMDEGVSHQQKLEIEERKRLANLDVLAFQAMNGDTRLGVQR